MIETKEVNSVNADNISYYGKVKVIVKDGDTVITKKYYKNTGGLNLFKFLALCLAGDYAAAKNICPAKIALYNSTTSAEPKEGTITLVSSVISNDTTPVVAISKNKVGYNVTYHFSVPYSKIMANDTEINQVLLFGNNATAATIAVNSAPANYYAYYNLTEGITPSDYSSNFNLVIEWTLYVQNGTSSN